ncbi:sensor histidine kinase [Mobiluncus mulieris]|uniref:sensor histidine kinase n=1 Tax=Mobiluncus mulieris TaxID=2052 RepID=UPI000E0FA36B|nr:ATP-binding protein [Mobiluncus mulieris]
MTKKTRAKKLTGSAMYFLAKGQYHRMTTGRLEAMVNLEKPEVETNRFIFDLPYNDHLIISEIVRRAEIIIGPQPRVEYPKGAKLTVEGQPITKVILALSGAIALEHHSEAGDILMHHASTGNIIGLLGATDMDAAFFTAIATTPVTGVVLSLPQLNEVIDADNKISNLVTTLFLRTLDRRLRRAEALHIEQAELATQLNVERENLARALKHLEEAREEMAAQARFASLGELAAGVAHELNNPMAAIRRNADYLNEDTVSLLETSPDLQWQEHALKSLQLAQHAKVLSTKEQRQIKREMREITGDPVLTQKLILAGIHDLDLAKTIAESDDKTLGVVELAAAIGTNLRDLRTASERIVELVASLRSYARPDGDPVEDIDVPENLEDTLRLLNHRLRAVKVIRNYEELPRITCRPGQLSEIWTNVITNAVEAMSEHASDPNQVGSLTITTQTIGENRIRVCFRDTGPGIPPEIINHIFEPHFTTKAGQVRFGGMGIGLGLCKKIALNHGGSIDLKTVENPQGTLATVELPVKSPQTPELVGEFRENTP